MKNIVLVGFMGSGKTTIGKKLAQELKINFVDTDDVTEERAGKPIKQIFVDEGEDHFRQLEKSVVSEVSARTNQVIACGGGVVLDPCNVEALKENGTLIYLEASAEVICNRVKPSTERPLLNVGDQKNQVKELLCTREKIYEQVTDVTINTSDLSAEQVIEKVKEKLDSMVDGE